MSEPAQPATPVGATGKISRPDALRLQGAQTAQLKWRRGDAPEKHYPQAARAERLDGFVLVDLLVNAEGQVLEAQVISESPPGAGFGLAALDVAKTYEYDNPLHRLVLMSITVGFLP